MYLAHEEGAVVLAGPSPMHVPTYVPIYVPGARGRSGRPRRPFPYACAYICAYICTWRTRKERSSSPALPLYMCLYMCLYMYLAHEEGAVVLAGPSPIYVPIYVP